MSKTLDELSVVIPVYDEAANIAGLLGEIEAYLDGRVHYEVIVRGLKRRAITPNYDEVTA